MAVIGPARRQAVDVAVAEQLERAEGAQAHHRQPPVQLTAERQHLVVHHRLAGAEELAAMVEPVTLQLDPEPGGRIGVEQQAVVEHLAAPRGVEPLPIEEHLAAAGRVLLAPLDAVLDRPGDVEEGALERLEVPVPVLGDERAEHAERVLGAVAEAEDRLERVEETRIAALVVAVEARRPLRSADRARRRDSSGSARRGGFRRCGTG